MAEMMNVISEMGLGPAEVAKWRAQFGGNVQFDMKLLAEGLQYLAVTKEECRVEAFKKLGFSPWAQEARDDLVVNDWVDHAASLEYGLVLVDDDVDWGSGGSFLMLLPVGCLGDVPGGGLLEEGLDMDFRLGPCCLASLTVGADEEEDLVVQEQVFEAEECVAAAAPYVDRPVLTGVEMFEKSADVLTLREKQVYPVPEEYGTGYGYRVCFSEDLWDKAVSVLGPYPTLDRLLPVYMASWRAGLAVGDFHVHCMVPGLFVSVDRGSGVMDSMTQLIESKRCGWGDSRVGLVVEDTGACYLKFLVEECRAAGYTLYGMDPAVVELAGVFSSWVLPEKELLLLRCDLFRGRHVHVVQGGRYLLMDVFRVLWAVADDVPRWLPESSGSFSLDDLSANAADVLIGGFVERVDKFLRYEEPAAGVTTEVGGLVGFVQTVKKGVAVVEEVSCEGMEIKVICVGDDTCVLLAHDSKLEGFLPLVKYSSVECLSVLRQLEVGSKENRKLRCFLPPVGYRGVDVAGVAGVPGMPMVAYLRKFPESVTHRDMEQVLLGQAACFGMKVDLDSVVVSDG